VRDTARINREIMELNREFGNDRVFWPRSLQWAFVKDWPLPRGLTKAATNVIIIIPENYGNGGVLRDSFIDPDLKALNPATDDYQEIPHYYKIYPYQQLSLGTKEEWAEKRWRYICLHEQNMHFSIMRYLIHLYKFLAEPFKDWKGLFNSYSGR